MNTMALEEKQISTKRIYDGKIVNLRVDTVLLPNGREALREVIEHVGAVCVVPVMPDGTVYLVRQYRYPFAEAVLEIPAGKLDAGEQPVDAANRELEEEIGMKASELIYMGEFRPSVAWGPCRPAPACSSRSPGPTRPGLSSPVSCCVFGRRSLIPFSPDQVSFF